MASMKEFVSILAAQIREGKPASKPDDFDEDKYPFAVKAGDNKFGCEDCPTCGKPATSVNRQGYPPKMFLFSDRLSAQEYGISAMCQSCQDSTFIEDEEEGE